MRKAINICIDCQNALTCPWVMRLTPQRSKWLDSRPTKVKGVGNSYQITKCLDFQKTQTKRERVLAVMQQELGISLETAKTYTQRNKLPWIWQTCVAMKKEWVYNIVEDYIKWKAFTKKEKNSQKSLS